jgi:hypothetical protein
LDATVVEAPDPKVAVHAAPVQFDGVADHVKVGEVGGPLSHTTVSANGMPAVTAGFELNRQLANWGAAVHVTVAWPEPLFVPPTPSVTSTLYTHAKAATEELSVTEAAEPAGSGHAASPLTFVHVQVVAPGHCPGPALIVAAPFNSGFWDDGDGLQTNTVDDVTQDSVLVAASQPQVPAQVTPVILMSCACEGAAGMKAMTAAHPANTPARKLDFADCFIRGS